MNRLHKAVGDYTRRSPYSVDRDESELNIHDTALRQKPSRVALVRQRIASTSLRTRILLVLLGVFVVALMATMSNFDPKSNSETVNARDPFFNEPETKVVVPATPDPKYLKQATCPVLPASPISEKRPVLEWVPKGQQVFKAIKDRSKANLEGGIWSDHFGFGKQVVLSNDGNRMAMSYEGEAGFDKAFGLHIDVMFFNGTHWNLEQTITDVTRGHGHEARVRFQSLDMSRDGKRIAFSDGHGVSVFRYDKSKQKKWQLLSHLLDPMAASELAVGKKRKFGTDLALNCDGTVMAISGTVNRASYTKVYQETYNPHLAPNAQYGWSDMGAIQGIKFGGSIALNAAGSRLAVGTVASEAWRGIVQVWDHTDGSWTRIGQPVVGKFLQEMWGGKVTLSADGSLLVVTSNNGAANRVQAYRLSATTPQMWEPYATELLGAGNAHEHFGADVALNHDGTILAVGAPGDFEAFSLQTAENKTVSQRDIPFLTGGVYMYRLDAVKEEWIRIDSGELSSDVEGDLYGQSVSLSAAGTRLLGGAPRRTGKAYQHILGSVHVYEGTIRH